MQRDSWYSSMRAAEDLASPEAVGRYAAERALARLKGRRVKTASVPVLFELLSVKVGLPESVVAPKVTPAVPEVTLPPEPSGVSLSAQAVATVGLLPLTVALFGQASLAGPFANLVTAFVVLTIMCMVGLTQPDFPNVLGPVADTTAAWCTAGWRSSNCSTSPSTTRGATPGTGPPSPCPPQPPKRA